MVSFLEMALCTPTVLQDVREGSVATAPGQPHLGTGLWQCPYSCVLSPHRNSRCFAVVLCTQALRVGSGSLCSPSFVFISPVAGGKESWLLEWVPLVCSFSLTEPGEEARRENSPIVQEEHFPNGSDSV